MKSFNKFTVAVTWWKEALQRHHGGSFPGIFEVVAAAICSSVSFGRGSASSAADGGTLVFEDFCADLQRTVVGPFENIFWVSVEK